LPYGVWGVEQVPKVFSISYADDENEVEEAYAQRVSVELLKAAARGITMLAASGDFGVGGNTNQICHGKPFVPTFPGKSKRE
jgi:tripeptidyl-peptidase-1